jgi:hypothetical protein
MSETSPESPAGDYSYDLAHEADTAEHPSQPSQRDRRVPVEHATDRDQAADQAADQGGDYSYDLAHDVPPAGD